MIYVAHLTAGVVTQVTVEPDDFATEPGQAIIGPNNVVGIGWTYNGSVFAPPIPIPE